MNTVYSIIIIIVLNSTSTCLCLILRSKILMFVNERTYTIAGLISRGLITGGGGGGALAWDFYGIILPSLYIFLRTLEI